jgi:zinc protease
MNAQNLGSSVSANHSSLKDDGLFDVSWQTNDASKLNTAQALLLKLVGDIAQSGVNAEELTRAQTFYATRSENLKNSADGFGSTLAEAAAAGDWRLSFWHRDQMQTTTIADTQRVASQYLVESNRVRASYIPQASPVRAPQAVPSDLGNYVAAPSALAQARTANAPVALQRFEPTANELDARTVSATLPVGTRMAMIARPAVGDAISGTLRLHWGNLETMRGQWAVSLMGSYLLRGTANRSQKQLEDDLNTLQSTMSIQSSMNGLTLNFQTTRQHWPAFAALMQDVLRQPGFKEGAFLTWKKSLIATWQAGRDAPETLASIAMNRALYAYDTTDPRYLPSNEEAIEAMNKVSIDDVKAFWAAFAGASVSEFAAVGALDAAQIQSEMAKVLADWGTPGGAASYQRIPRPLPNYTAKRLVIPTIDKPNAGLRATRLFTMQPLTREGYALQLASDMLGASSSSRLFTRLRKEEGLSYGTNSSLSASEDDLVANFTIQGTFAPQNLAKFETALAQTLKDVEIKGFTVSELERVKRSLSERVQAARNSDAAVAASLANNAFRSTPQAPRNFARAEQMNALALSVTLEDVNAAAKQLVDLRKAVVVVTGDFK